MAVNLLAAHKKTNLCAAYKALLAYFYYHATHTFSLACSTQKIAHVQYTKVDLRAANFMSHACFDLSHDKN